MRLRDAIRERIEEGNRNRYRDAAQCKNLDSRIKNQKSKIKNQEWT
jgi:hypothetical protein